MSHAYPVPVRTAQVTAPPPGCVGQRLSALGALQPERLHSELDIPRAPHAPYSLQLLLDMFKDQYLAFIQRMNEPDFAKQIRQQIDKEKVLLFISILIGWVVSTIKTSRPSK